MSLSDDFESAVQRMNGASKAPSQGDMLKLYGLFKQAKGGDASGGRPGMTKIRERAKFDAWAANKGKSQDTAMQEYIALVDSLVG